MILFFDPALWKDALMALYLFTVIMLYVTCLFVLCGWSQNHLNCEPNLPSGTNKVTLPYVSSGSRLPETKMCFWVNTLWNVHLQHDFPAAESREFPRLFLTIYTFPSSVCKWPRCWPPSCRCYRCVKTSLLSCTCTSVVLTALSVVLEGFKELVAQCQDAKLVGIWRFIEVM